jgi:hypothetical protein
MSANNNVYVSNGSVDNPPYNVVLTAPANGSTVSGSDYAQCHRFG